MVSVLFTHKTPGYLFTGEPSCDSSADLGIDPSYSGAYLLIIYNNFKWYNLYTLIKSIKKVIIYSIYNYSKELNCIV